MEQTFNLHAEGEKLTGTVTSRQEERTRGIARKEIVNISDDKIRENEISFTTAYKTKGYLIILPFLVLPRDRTWRYSYKGVVSSDQIKLTRALDRKRPPVPAGRVCCISSSGKVKGQELTLIRVDKKQSDHLAEASGLGPTSLGQGNVTISRDLISNGLSCVGLLR